MGSQPFEVKIGWFGGAEYRHQGPDRPVFVNTSETNLAIERYAPMISERVTMPRNYKFDKIVSNPRSLRISDITFGLIVIGAGATAYYLFI